MAVRDQTFLLKHFPEQGGLFETIRIIALIGRRRSGKTSAAMLIQEQDPRFKILSFAGTLKDMFAKENNIDRSNLDDPNRKEMFREEIQKFSEKYLASDPFYFVKKLVLQIKPGDRIIIDDLRYIHELWALFAMGAQFYSLQTEKHVRQRRGWTYNAITDNHLSETELGDLSSYTMYRLGGYSVYNNGDMDCLKEQILQILKSSIKLEIA